MAGCLHPHLKIGSGHSDVDPDELLYGSRSYPYKSAGLPELEPEISKMAGSGNPANPDVDPRKINF